jgi:hypothetical protein
VLRSTSLTFPIALAAGLLMPVTTDLAPAERRTGNIACWYIGKCRTVANSQRDVSLVRTGAGFTVIENDALSPVQPFATGLTITFDTAGFRLLFIPVKDGILPVPETGRPVATLSFTHVKAAPPTLLLKLIAEVGVPLQTAWLAWPVRVGRGLTVIEKVSATPAQPFMLGETTIVAVTGTLLLLSATNGAIDPEIPLAGIPICG